MKKLLATLFLLSIVWGVNAQNLYVLGESGGSAAEYVIGVYKNGNLLYVSPNHGALAAPKTILCDSDENIFWMVTYSKGYSEIRKNSKCLINTNNTNITLSDIYLKHDTLYYVGYETIDSISVAKIWKGDDFLPYRTFGDGIHPSAILATDMDESTGNVYYCGYLCQDTGKLPAVWSETELLYTLPNPAFAAEEISIDHGNIFTFNLSRGLNTCVKVYNNATQQYSRWFYDRTFHGFCVQNNDWYTHEFDHYGGHGIYKNGDEPVLDFGQASLVWYNYPITKIKRLGNDIYAVGYTEQGYSTHIGTIWKNFEPFLTIDNCSVVGDFCYSVSPLVTDEYTIYPNLEYRIYPNPTDGILHVETQCIASLPMATEYRITNLMGQTLLQGRIDNETQQINIESLPAGMYFITLGKTTQKILVR